MDDLKTVLGFMLEYGGDGSLPNMDEGGSGDIAYAAALRLADLQKGMTKAEVLNALTNLYDMCVSGSSEPDDGWSRIAGAISTAEDVARQEATDYNKERVRRDETPEMLQEQINKLEEIFRGKT